MIFWGFRSAFGSWGIATGSHSLGSSEFNLKHVMAFSNSATDGCSVDGIEFDAKDQRYFKVLLRFDREDISERAQYKFHLIYSTDHGRLYKQTIEHDRKTRIWPPTDLFLDRFNVTTD